MAPHSSTLAWKIPWTEEPGRLQSMGSLGVGHDWTTSLSLFTFMHWRRKWQPTPMFLPGESQGQGNLVGCCLWGRTESDTTEATWQQQHCVWGNEWVCRGINSINQEPRNYDLMIGRASEGEWRNNWRLTGEQNNTSLQKPRGDRFSRGWKWATSKSTENRRFHI